MVTPLVKGLARLCKTHNVTIHAKTDARGAAGGKVPTWASSGVPRTCWIQPLITGERVYGLQPGDETTHALLFAVNPVSYNDDKIAYGTRTFIQDGNAKNVAEVSKLWVVFAREIEHRDQETV